MEKNWYIVHTYSGYEKHAKEHLEKRIRSAKMGDFFGEILIPTETVIELFRGKKREKSKKFFPSYIFINMHLNDDSWHLVKGTPKVTGFVGSNKKRPQPIDESQVKKLVSMIEEGDLQPKIKIDFEEGEAVKVIDGPFSNFHGVVEEVNSEKSRVKVMVSIFGRSTPVEFEFSQVEKLTE